MPFSFKEMCKVKDISKDRVSEKDFMEYLNFGGMPQRFLMETESQVKIYLRDLYDSIVLRDIVLRSKVSDVDVLNRNSRVYGYEYFSNIFGKINIGLF